MRIVFPILLGVPLGGGLSWLSAHVHRLARTPIPRDPLDDRLEAGNATPGRPRWHRGGAVVASSILLLALELRFDPFWSRPLVLAVSIFFLLVALVDLRHRLVLDAMVIPAALVALVAQLIGSPDALVVALIGGVFGLAPFLATALVKPGGMGGGDVKLAGLVGLTLGFPRVMWGLAVAVIAGGIVSLLLLLSKEWELGDHLPYAPFLCLGVIVALLHDPVTPILLSIAR